MSPFLRARPRRNRKSEVVRSFHRETHLGPEHFIYPLFLHEEGDAAIPIASMPGCMRHTLASLEAVPSKLPELISVPASVQA